jgi:hypothetical protein
MNYSQAADDSGKKHEQKFVSRKIKHLFFQRCGV